MIKLTKRCTNKIKFINNTFIKNKYINTRFVITDSASACIKNIKYRYKDTEIILT